MSAQPQPEIVLDDYAAELAADFWGCVKHEYQILSEDEESGNTALIHPEPHEEQALLQAEVERQLATRGFARVIVVKPRKVGVSTWAQMLGVNVSQLVPFTKMLTMSYDQAGTNLIWDIAHTVVDNIVTPEAFPRVVSKAKKPGSPIVWENGSRAEYWTQGGSGSANKGRGGTPTVLIVEELPGWEEGRKNTTAADVAQGMWTSVGERKGSIVLIVFTAKGVGNLAHRMAMRAYLEEPGNLFKLMFFPFQQHRAYRVPIEDPQARADAFALSQRMHESHEAKDHTMAWDYARRLGYTRLEFDRATEFKLDPEQVGFWRRKKKNDFDDDQNRFDQEFPMSLDIAFSSSGSAYLPGTIVKELLDKAAKLTPLRGSLVRGEDKKVTFVEDGGDWMLFERPVAGEVYLIGNDVASGLKGPDHDNTAIAVTSRKTKKLCLGYYGQPQPEETAAELDKAGEWYNDALIAVECKEDGIAVLQHLRDRYPDRQLYHRVAPPDTTAAQWTPQVGFRTDQKTKPLLYSLMSTALRKNTHENLDPRFLRELPTIKRDQTGKVIGAPKGFHDDYAIAFGITIVIDYELAEVGEPETKKAARALPADPEAREEFEPGEFDEPEEYQWA